MSNLYWLSEAQMERLKPFFPKSHGKPRVDDRRVLSGIIFRQPQRAYALVRRTQGIRSGQDALQPLEALERQWCLRPDHGRAWPPRGAEHKTIMIDATYLKAHRTASSLCVKKGIADARSAEPKGGMNTKLHAIADANGRPTQLLHDRWARSATTPARLALLDRPAEGAMAAGRPRL
jgi:hypothetical protein